MTSRTYCSTCHYPLRTCVCSVVQKIKSHSLIDIIQHPSESKHAKNTTRLCQLCMDNLLLWRGELPEDFIALQNHLNAEKRRIVVVYPNNNAAHIEDLNVQNKHGLRLIFLDGTWRKVYKLWQLNPWLQQYPSVSINSIESTYAIRKAPKEGQLSTLEAISFTLNKLEPQCDTQPLLNCLETLKESYQYYKPPL